MEIYVLEYTNCVEEFFSEIKAVFSTEEKAISFALNDNLGADYDAERDFFCIYKGELDQPTKFYSQYYWDQPLLHMGQKVKITASRFHTIKGQTFTIASRYGKWLHLEGNKAAVKITDVELINKGP